MIEWELDNGYSYIFRPSTVSRSPSVSPLDGLERKRVKSGDHRDEGIFLASGAQLTAPMEIKEARIIDLTPTILYLLGVPIPPNLDGEVLTQIFADAYLAKHPIQYGHALGANGNGAAPPRDYSAREEAAIKARLQGLGYIE
jgi:hypothetical protein